MLGSFHFHCFSERCNEILEIVCFYLSLEGGNLDMKADTAVLLCRLTFSECFCSLALQDQTSDNLILDHALFPALLLLDEFQSW